MNPFKKSLLLSLALLSLYGCSSIERVHQQSQVAFDAGRYEQAIQQLTLATTKHPKSLALRSQLLYVKEYSLLKLMHQIAQAREKGDTEQALSLVKRAQAIDGQDQRIGMLRQEVERDQRHGVALATAEQLLLQNHLDTALEQVNYVLRENLNNPKALDIKQKIERLIDHSDTAVNEPTMPLLSFEFRDVSVKLVLDAISKQTGINFVLEKDMRADQKTSIALKNTPLNEALDILTLGLNLSRKKIGDNTWLIFQNTPEKQREHQELFVRSFYLSHNDVKNIANQIKSMLKIKELIIDEKLNILIVRDSKDVIRLAEKIIHLLDVNEPEVMLDVEVIEINRSKLLELGINYPDQFIFTPLLSSGSSGQTINTLGSLNKNLIGVGVSGLTLNFRNQVGDLNLLSNPKIRVKNREKAKVLIGDKVPTITTTTTATGLISESIQYTDVGLKLEVEPLISLDDNVNIKLALEVSSLAREVKTNSGSLAYQIGTRSVNTVLKLRDGETEVLAGLISDEDRSSSNRIPFLGDLPLASRLFGSQRDSRQKTEIVLSITPHIVRNLRRPNLIDSEFSSGTENKSKFTQSLKKISSIDTENKSLKKDALKDERKDESRDALTALKKQATPEINKNELNVKIKTMVQDKIKVNEPFFIDIMINDIKGLDAIPIEIIADPQKLYFLNATLGTSITEYQPAMNQLMLPDGKILISLSQLDKIQSNSASKKDFMNIVRLNFKPLSEGEATLKVLTANPITKYKINSLDISPAPKLIIEP